MIPNLNFLGYSEKKPRLRVIHFADQTCEAADAVADTPIAYSRLYSLVNWLAIDAHQELWSLPLPLGNGQAKKIAESFDSHPSLDGRFMWTRLGAGPGNGLWALVDRDGIAQSEPFESELRLDAVTPSGLVMRKIIPTGGSPLYLRGPDGSLEQFDEGFVVGSSGSKVIVESGFNYNAELRIVDLESGQRTAVMKAGIARWQKCPSVAPNGKHFVVGADLDGEHATVSASRQAVLVDVDLITGSSIFCEGRFENFAWRPTWTCDGEWVVFGAPFEEGRLYVMNEEARTLIPIDFPARHVAMPMMDMRALQSAALDS